MSEVFINLLTKRDTGATRHPHNKMIDRTKFLPAGALPIRQNSTGVGGVFCYIIDREKGKVEFPGDIKDFDINKETRNICLVMDYFKQKATATNVNPWKDQRMDLFNRQQSNYEANREKIEPHTFMREDTVIICGGGPSLNPDIEKIEQHRDKVCVITINGAQARIKGDYFVTSESIDLLIHSTNTLLTPECIGDTIAHVSNTTHPNVVNLPWNDLTFYSHGFEYEDKYDIPMYYVGRHSTFDALQFATTVLKAKKVIFTGVDYIYVNQVEHLSVMLIEAGSLIASMNGTEVWNISNRTAFKNGVKLGTFEEAMNLTNGRRKKGRNNFKRKNFLPGTQEKKNVNLLNLH